MTHTRVGLFVITALAFVALIGVASAADYNVVTPSNNVVFIGEQGLDVSAIVGTSPTSISYYASGSIPGVDAPTSTQTIGDPTNFYVAPSDFASFTGLWYQTGNTANVINVQSPSIAVSIRNAVGDDISGKAVTRGEKLDFRIETNMYSIFNRGGTGTFPLKVKVASPGGLTYTGLYIDNTNVKPLTGLPVNTNLWLWKNHAPVGAWDTNARDGSGSVVYSSGTYSVSVECNANNIKDNYNPVDGKTASTVKTVAISSDQLVISTSADSVVRGTQFVISITGIPNTPYRLFVESVGSDKPPYITANQEGVALVNPYTALVTTSSSGTRSVGFYTDKDTKAKKWTIRVETTSADKYDTTTVTVKEGVVTMVASGDGSYYLGQEVTLTGTNTETDTVYFFITGPNLPSGGARLDAPTVAVVSGNPSSFVSTDVRDDKTFEYKWNTAGLAIDAGTYTIYAVSAPVNRDNLGNAQYATVPVNLRKPFINAAVTPTNVAAGDKAFIRGTAEGQPSPGVAIWIMGKNYVKYTTTSVDDDGTFEYELSGGETQNLASGQYYVVVQHPMYNDKLDVYPKADGGYQWRYVVGPYPVLNAENIIFTLQGPGSLQGSDAANALVTAIDNPSVDDIGTQIQFVIAQPQITVKQISQVTIGQKFTVSGLTNLAIGEDLLIEVVSSSFGPTSKNQAGGFSGFSGTVKIAQGTDQWNAFSLEVPSDNFIVDEYIVTVSSVEVTAASGSTTFNVVQYVPTPTPTPTTPPTTPPTTIPTTVPTTTPTPTPTPTKTPGFGAVIAVVGLCSVGYLIVRKKDDEETAN